MECACALARLPLISSADVPWTDIPVESAEERLVDVKRARIQLTDSCRMHCYSRWQHRRKFRPPSSATSL